MIRPCWFVVGGMAAGAAALGLTLADAGWRQVQDAPRHQRVAELAATLGLTDLALFTEARYTRHPSLADRHAAFQDGPGALEHFPSGSLLPPRPWREPAP